MTGYRFLCTLLLFTASLALAKDRSTASHKIPFNRWVNIIKKKAQAKGISTKTLKTAFHKVTHPLEKIITLDRNQPEIKLTFEDYYEKRVPCLVQKGKKLSHKYRTLLRKTQKKYGIPKEIILALWGRETHYGSFTGKTPTIHALATLAWDGRREKLFTDELFHALKILDDGHISHERFVGSWAGAIGQCQFMPSSFHNHAVDTNAKGRKDIWSTLPDVFASIGNYLKKAGWKSDQPCVWEVQLPKNTPTFSKNIHDTQSLCAWGKLGVLRKDGRPLKKSALQAALIRPEKSTRAFLVFENIRVILDWNRSLNFALSVGLLANAIHGGDLEHA